MERFSQGLADNRQTEPGRSESFHYDPADVPEVPARPLTTKKTQEGRRQSLVLAIWDRLGADCLPAGSVFIDSMHSLRKLTDGRAKSFTDIVEDTKGGLVSYMQLWTLIDPDRATELEKKAKAITEGQRERKGRPPVYGPEHYAKVALIYETAYLHQHDPTRAVAEHWSVNPSTAANWVAKARQMEFLGKGTRGKPGGLMPHNEGEEE